MDVDLKAILEHVERKYRLRLPSRVIMADYDPREGDLYVRFREADLTEGEPTSDGLVLLHYDRQKRLAAVEILDITAL